MSQLSDYDLQGIFEHSSGTTLKSGYERAQLFDLSQRNVLMISLIAGQYKTLAEHSDGSEQPSDILSGLFSGLGTLHCRQKTKVSLKPYKNQHDKEKLDFLGHIKYVYTHFFDSYPGYEKERELLKNLCYFGCSPIPLILLQKVLPDYDMDTISSLSDMGMLILTEESIQLTPLISLAVSADIKSSSKEDTTRHLLLCSNMMDFLKEYDTTLSIPYVPDILIAFAKNLYRNVKPANNDKQKKASSLFEERQDLMYMIFSYYNQNGDATYSSELIRLLDYPKRVKNAHSRLDPCFFRLANSIQSCSSPAEIIVVIDELLLYISGQHNDVSTTNIVSLVTTVLDMIVGLYCTNVFTMLKGTPALMQYQFTLSAAMKKLVDYIPYLQKQTNLYISDEKLSYYETCLELMTDFVPHPDSFDRMHNKIKAWKNINCRICATALLTFVQSWHIYMVNISCPTSPCDYDHSYLAPKMAYMSGQIQGCALVPSQPSSSASTLT